MRERTGRVSSTSPPPRWTIRMRCLRRRRSGRPNGWPGYRRNLGCPSSTPPARPRNSGRSRCDPQARAAVPEETLMIVMNTGRLVLRQFSLDDAPFILRLLNEPSFVQHIADKGVRDLEGARGYLREGPMASYERHGFGLWLVSLAGGDTAIGMAGLLKRDYLDHMDIGYAFLPEYGG